MVFQLILVQYVRAATATAIRIRIATTVIMIQTDQVRQPITARHQQAGLPEVTIIREATAIIIAGVTIATVLTAALTTAIPAGLILRQVQAQVLVLVHLAEVVVAAAAAVHPEGHPGSVSC
jgi:hypothetical protein